MSVETSRQQELDAFINFFKTFDLSRPLSNAVDLNDGTIFFDILSLVDDVYFRQPRPSSQPSENWVLRFSALKRLYRLMTQYFADILHKPTTSLDVPDLQALAKDSDVAAALGLCRLAVVIGVQCERNKDFIEKIQGLSEEDQHFLMKAIEQVMGKIVATNTNMDVGGGEMTEDDHYYRVQSERSQLFSEKETLERTLQSLMEQHAQLQAAHDDVIQERDDALAQLRASSHTSENRRNERADVMLRAELDRVRADLQKSEDNLAMTEAELEKSTNTVTELTRKVDELQAVADEAAKLKDQLDEYRHAADKLHKTENVMQKYKKKLQESADLRHQLKALEQQNSDLVNKNAALEEDYRKVAAFKPLMESYKTQIADLETKASARQQDIETLKFELEQAKTKLKIAQEEKAKDAESLELYQERVKELELFSNSRPARLSHNRRHESTASEDFSAQTPVSPTTELERSLGMAQTLQGLGEELDDAITGRTTTDLKLQIKKLERELEAHKKNEADASRILVLENLLEDANRMKTRYEQDYLTAHREKLLLQRDLEEIRSGKSLGDGPEAAIALRQRLNESVDQLDALRKEHAELEVKFDTVNRELTIAKSDLTLVNKDQLDILASLRESVNEDKLELEQDVERLKKQNKELAEKNRMQLEQVNGLLMEKMTLQAEGISHREKMLLQRDIKDLSNELNSALPGNVPEEFKRRWLVLHEDSIAQKETIKTLDEKLAKAKQVLKLQDKLIKEANANSIAAASQGAVQEASANFQSQIKALEEELAQAKAKLKECHARYAREHELMLSALHNIGMRSIRQQLGSPGSAEKTSFLAKQRNASNSVLRRA